MSKNNVNTNLLQLNRDKNLNQNNKINFMERQASIEGFQNNSNLTRLYPK